MKPKTKQEAQRLINELRSVIDELPDEGRCVVDGWMASSSGYLRRTTTSGFQAYCRIATVEPRGLVLSTHAQLALDGIAHDSKGRIKVVGYVNAEELKERLPDALSSRTSHISLVYLRELIDELTG